MLITLALQLGSLTPAPLTPPQVVDIYQTSTYQNQVLELAAQEGYPQQQIVDLRPAPEQHAELAQLLPYATYSQAKLIAVLASGCDKDSVLCDALLQLAVRSRNLDVRLACLLAPDQVPRRYVPALAQISLSSEIDLSLRALACARIIENGFYSAWPLARAILLTGTATDSEQGHPYPDWRRSGRYELPKRLLCIQLQKVFKQRHQAAFVFEPNAAWKIQEQQIAAIDAQLKRFQPPRVESSFQVLANSKHPLAPAITDLLGLD